MLFKLATINGEVLINQLLYFTLMLRNHITDSWVDKWIDMQPQNELKCRVNAEDSI